ncbi:hypothetical protein [Celeribacter sp.]|uniref:hypothetical protein n=1 Tax=Celeribacter sp. TaxID=1890673 RepID=UPI003A8CC3CF
MRILAGLLTMTVLGGCQMAVPAFNAAPASTDDAAVAAMVSDATGSEVVVDGESDTSQAQELADAFEEAATPAPEPKGLFAFLKPAPQPSPLEGTDIEVIESAEAQEAETTATQKGNGGIFAFLKPKTQTPAAPVAPQSDAPSESASDVETAALAPDALEAEDAAEPAPVEAAAAPAKKGLFGGLFAGGGAAGGPKTLSTVQPGEVLPFGTVGIACEVKPTKQAKLVDQFPREGRAVWKLYDTDPSSTSARTQFITGFKDNCPRQVTASLVMFGSAALHEVHRYSKDREQEAWSQADKAYEKIKAKSCSVRKGVGCPAEKLPKLESHMAFVSVYKTFGGAGNWLELLLADGKLVTEEVR